jgi:NitT/TauT family transport system substrate-binding protein
MSGRTILGGLLAVAALVGVTSGGVTSAAAEETLRVGKAVGQAFTFLPLDLGIKAGIFKKHGFTVESTAFGGAAKYQQALAANSIDIGLGGGADLFFVAKGIPSIGVAETVTVPQLLVLVVRKDDPMQGPDGLKGKTISVTTLGSSTDWMVHQLSVHQGWGPDGITVLPLGETRAQIAAMKNKETDGFVVDVTVAYQMEQQGEGKILVRFGDIIKDYIMHIIYARQEFAETHPDSVKRFLAGWFETIAYMRQHKEETVGVATEIMGVSAAVAGRAYDELLPTFTSNGKFDPKGLKVLGESFAATGALPEVPDMSKLITEKYLP